MCHLTAASSARIRQLGNRLLLGRPRSIPRFIRVRPRLIRSLDWSSAYPFRRVPDSLARLCRSVSLCLIARSACSLCLTALSDHTCDCEARNHRSQAQTVAFAISFRPGRLRSVCLSCVRLPHYLCLPSSGVLRRKKKTNDS